MQLESVMENKDLKMGVIMDLLRRLMLYYLELYGNLTFHLNTLFFAHKILLLPPPPLKSSYILVLSYHWDPVFESF